MFNIEQAGTLTVAGLFVFGVIVGAVVFDGEYSPSIFGSSITIAEYTGGTEYYLELHGFGIVGHKVSVTQDNGECFEIRYITYAIAFYDREYNVIWATPGWSGYKTDSSVEVTDEGGCGSDLAKEVTIKMREKPVRVSHYSAGETEYRTF